MAMENLTLKSDTLTPHQLDLLGKYEQADFDPSAFAKATNQSLFQAILFLAQPVIKAVLDEFDRGFAASFQRAADRARLVAVQILNSVLTAATDPIEIRRISSLLLRAAGPMARLRGKLKAQSPASATDPSDEPPPLDPLDPLDPRPAEPSRPPQNSTSNPAPSKSVTATTSPTRPPTQSAPSVLRTAAAPNVIPSPKLSALPATQRLQASTS